MVNPLVETLFDMDNGIWKDFFNDKLLPKLNSYAVGSLVGINRILLMIGFIEPAIFSEKMATDILNRQVKLQLNLIIL
jgi:hypothetical protein